MADGSLTPAAQPIAGVGKGERQRWIRTLLRENDVRSQSELCALLLEHGIDVTQATLSRDLVEVGALKVRRPDGTLIYAVPDPHGADPLQWSHSQDAADTRLQRLCAELLVTAQVSHNLVVVRTPPGAAQLLASAMDAARWPDVIGTIAGDDTVMVIVAESASGSDVAARLMNRPI